MFSRFRILCALRRGPYGVTEINRLCERILFEGDLIRVGSWSPEHPPEGEQHPGDRFEIRPHRDFDSP